MNTIVSMIEFRHILQSAFHEDISYIMGFDIHNAADMDISVTDLICIYLLIDYLPAVPYTAMEHELEGALFFYLSQSQWDRFAEIQDKHKGELYEQKH